MNIQIRIPFLNEIQKRNVLNDLTDVTWFAQRRTRWPWYLYVQNT